MRVSNYQLSSGDVIAFQAWSKCTCYTSPALKNRWHFRVFWYVQCILLLVCIVEYVTYEHL
jgi:hypothetical protein